MVKIKCIKNTNCDYEMPEGKYLFFEGNIYNCYVSNFFQHLFCSIDGNDILITYGGVQKKWENSKKFKEHFEVISVDMFSGCCLRCINKGAVIYEKTIFQTSDYVCGVTFTCTKECELCFSPVKCNLFEPDSQTS